MTTPEQTLQTLATLDPDYPAFIASLPPNILPTTVTSLPNGMAEDIISLLKTERPELTPWLDSHSAAPTSAKQAFGPLETTAIVLGAILFLLRSHIKIQGEHFLFEHKPMNNTLLGKVLDKLAVLLGGKAEL